MGHSPPPAASPDDLRAAAATLLGPAAAQFLASPAGAALARARLRGGADLTDAVLGVAHGSAREDPGIASEFAGWLLLELRAAGRGLAGPALRRFLDTGDLVQSVAGDLWPELFELRFETRGQFLALFAARLRWKAVDRARMHQSGQRREDLRVEARDEDLEPAGVTPSPATEAADREEAELLALALARLSARDAEMIRAWLAGDTWERIGAAAGIAAESARKAVQRAIAHAREIAERG